MTDLYSFWTNFKRRGLHYLNTFLPDVHGDFATLFLQNTFLLLIGLSSAMMIIGEGGILYSSMRLPLFLNLKVLGVDTEIVRAHPEQGMHWTTILMYSFMAYYLLTVLPRRGMKGFHTIAFTLCIGIATFVFPWEWIYVPLLDIFHNFPVEGTMSTLFYGYWRPFPIIIMNSVIGRNGIMAFGLLFAHWIAKDAFNNDPKGYKRFKYNFNKKSVAIVLCFSILFVMWVALPAIVPKSVCEFKPENHKGTVWFPQTIYVWYAHAPESPSDLYDIVREEWLPEGKVEMVSNASEEELEIEPLNVSAEPISGAIIRLIQLPTKALTIIWVLYSFTPRVVEDEKRRN